MNNDAPLSRREREIMEIVYAEGQATAAAIRQSMKDAPGAAAVRKMLTILEGKGHLKHSKSGREHVYEPVKTKRSAAQTALKKLLNTFFAGSLRDAVAMHLGGDDKPLPEDELKEIARLVREAQLKAQSERKNQS